MIIDCVHDSLAIVTPTGENE